MIFANTKIERWAFLNQLEIKVSKQSTLSCLFYQKNKIDVMPTSSIKGRINLANIKTLFGLAKLAGKSV